ncbi:MAG: osmoprotectant NAGGN system M42 family peptidase [Actinobacteria bacterium]|nr:osmoprotectant NAGGN system M42 family peptidase [Actinomycetota bacterium]
MTTEPDTTVDGFDLLPDPADAPIDVDWMLDVLVRLLRTPSPSGRTDAVMQLVGELVDDIGLPFQLTRRGALIAELPGRSEAVDRACIVHADTIGAMVSRLKDNGRLEVIPIGTWSARFAEGCRVTVFPDDNRVTYTGTVLPLKASGHAFGDEVDTQGVGWDHVEVRIDEDVSDAAGLAALGIQVGDTVALVALPEITDTGFIVSRHLDGKAGVAAALAAAKAIVDGGIVPEHRANLIVTIAEEVGLGATHGLGPDVAEMVSIDNAVCAPGQHSIEDGVTIPMADLSGPFDYHLTRRLCHLCITHDIPHVRDTFRWYRSDVAAALEAGAETRAALIAFGLDASHGSERSTVASLTAVGDLLTRWLQTPLTFAQWDQTSAGPLKLFPSSAQPAPQETWERLPE